MQIEDKTLVEILQETLGKEGYDLTGVTGKDDLSSYGLNSVLAVGIVVKLENKFGIVIEDDDLMMENYSTIENIRNLLLKY